MSKERTPEDVSANLANLRAKLLKEGAQRDAGTRSKVQKVQRKTVGDRRALRATGRDALFPFRARSGLHARCKAAAKKRGMSLAAWMEEQLEAALAAEEKGASS